MFLSDWRPCPNYVPNNSESGPTEAAETEFGFGGSYLSFRPRLAVFWQAQLGWCWAELLPGEKNLFFFSFSSRHTGAAEYWSHSIKSVRPMAHGSELFIVGSQPLCLCLAGLLQPWSAIFDASHLWCCSFPTTWAELVCLEKAWLFYLDAQGQGMDRERTTKLILFILQRTVSLLLVAAFSLMTPITTY